MTLKHAARKYYLNARQTVAFIKNRHCSQVSLSGSLADAIHTADAYRRDEDTIAQDVCDVGANGGLYEYTSNFQPFKKLK